MNFNLLLIVGASARAAAQSARRGGFDVSAVDAFADADLKAVAQAVAVPRFPQGIREAVRRLPACDWLYVGGMENHPRIVDAVCNGRRLLGMRGESLRRLRDPFDLQRVLCAAGQDFPESTRTIADTRRHGEWLVKHRRSSGGLAVGPMDSECLTRAPRSDAYFQRRIMGMPFGAIFLGDGERSRLLGVTEQLLTPSPDGRQPFRYGGSIGPLSLSLALRRHLTALGELVAREYRTIGLFGIDLILDDAGNIWPIEINPRYTAGVEILERAFGRSLMASHVDACRHASIAASLAVEPTTTWYGKRVVYADDLSGTVPEAIVAKLMLRDRDGAWPSTADIPARGSAIVRGAPLATVFAAGESRESVIRQLAVRAAALYEEFREALH